MLGFGNGSSYIDCPRAALALAVYEMWSFFLRNDQENMVFGGPLFLMGLTPYNQIISCLLQ